MGGPLRALHPLPHLAADDRARVLPRRDDERRGEAEQRAPVVPVRRAARAPCGSLLFRLGAGAHEGGSESGR